MPRPGGCHSVFQLVAGQKSSLDCELIDRELKELQTSAGIPKAGSQQQVDSGEELASVIKVRELLSPLAELSANKI
jgi:hypothetical protein